MDARPVKEEEQMAMLGTLDAIYIDMLSMPFVRQQILSNLSTLRVQILTLPVRN